MGTIEGKFGDRRVAAGGALFSGDGHMYERNVLDECRFQDPEHIKEAIQLKTEIDPRFPEDLTRLSNLQGEERNEEAKRIIKFLLRSLERKPKDIQEELFQKALDLAKRFQPLKDSEPIELNNPQKPFLAELRQEIIDNMGFKGKEGDRLKVYTAVGTDVDYLFGTDAVVEFGEKGDRDYKIVTIDTTLRKEKLGKADIVLDREVKSVDNPDEENEFWEVVEDTNKKVCKKILVG